MRITIELRRPARRSIALMLAALALSIPAVVVASHQFTDVPTTHPFHDEIEAIADAGITAGFADGGYHPTDPVTRQAMAAFMQRGFGRVALATGGNPLTPSISADPGDYFSEYDPVRSVLIDVPGADSVFGPLQMVHVQGRVTFGPAAMTTQYGCPCVFEARIVSVSTGAISSTQVQSFESSQPGLYHSFDVEGVFLAEPGRNTFRLDVHLMARSNNAPLGVWALDARSSLSATTHPFGSTGGDSL